MTMTRNETHALDKAIAAAVLEAFVAGRPAMTADELATAVGVKVGAIRRRFDLYSGFVPGTTCDQESRPSYSKNYRGFQTGTHKVWVYGPSALALRVEIGRLRDLIGQTLDEKEKK